MANRPEVYILLGVSDYGTDEGFLGVYAKLPTHGDRILAMNGQHEYYACRVVKQQADGACIEVHPLEVHFSPM